MANAKQPLEPEDIFEEDKERPAVSPLAPRAPAPPPRSPSARSRAASLHRTPWGAIVGIVVLVLLGGVGGYVFFMRNTATAPISTNNTNGGPANGANENVNTTSPSNTPRATSSLPPDADGDGLTDEEEQGLGTDPKKVDSDGDGLSDREEVRVWKTDPAKRDTDGDRFQDGEEVKAGYDPKGPGKLLDLQRALQNTNQQP